MKDHAQIQRGPGHGILVLVLVSIFFALAMIAVRIDRMQHEIDQLKNHPVPVASEVQP
jgi:hypothetical protein